MLASGTGAQAKHVVKVTIFMTDVSERPLINPLRIEYFGESRPASTLVQVAQLVDPRLKVRSKLWLISTGERVWAVRAAITQVLAPGTALCLPPTVGVRTFSKRPT